MEKNSPRDNTIHLVYKELGETPNQALLRFKNKNREYNEKPITYAGRLDPLAEGLLLVLSGEKILEKDKYLNLPKCYTFDLLWGIETDTLDVLGISRGGNPNVPGESEVLTVLKLSGIFEQSYPAYSSKAVAGKPLFMWAKEGKLGKIKIPKHQVEIFNASFISRRTVSGEELLKDIISKISLVVGDFRQKEIIEKWKEVLGRKQEREFIIDTISMEVSSGFYIRQFAQDIAKIFGTIATIFHIKRTKVGDFGIENCL